MVDNIGVFPVKYFVARIVERQRAFCFPNSRIVLFAGRASPSRPLSLARRACAGRTLVSMSELETLRDQLTKKELAFCEAYLANGFNGTDAMRQAKYKGNDNVLGVSAYRMLRKPKVAAYIKLRFEELTMSPEEVLARLSAMARTDMTDFMQVYPGGMPAFDFEKAADAKQLGLIKKFKVTAKSIEMELYDAQAALVHLGKHHGLFAERLKLETWETEVLELLRSGQVTPEQVREDIGDKLADEFFKRVGPVIVGAGETTRQSQ